MAQFNENHFPSPPSVYSCSPPLWETQIQSEKYHFGGAPPGNRKQIFPFPHKGKAWIKVRRVRGSLPEGLRAHFRSARSQALAQSLAATFLFNYDRDFNWLLRRLGSFGGGRTVCGWKHGSGFSCVGLTLDLGERAGSVRCLRPCWGGCTTLGSGWSQREAFSISPSWIQLGKGWDPWRHT